MSDAAPGEPTGIPATLNAISDALERLGRGLDRPDFERLLTELRSAVSAGQFGLAAEISDRLAAAPDVPRRVLIQVRAERAKRLQYLGYREPVITEITRALAEIDDELATATGADRGELLDLRVSLVGHLIWLCTESAEATTLADRFDALLDDYEAEYGNSPVLRAFSIAQRGWIAALREQPDECLARFDEAKDLLADQGMTQVVAHILSRRCDALIALGLLDEAADLARELVFDLRERRSHLRLKATVDFLVTSSNLPRRNEDDIAVQRRHAEFLIGSTGMAPSVPVYRLLDPWSDSALLEAAAHLTTNRDRVTQRILSLTSASMEVLVSRLLELHGYVDVQNFADETVAFDILCHEPIASPNGIRSSIAVQVKHSTLQLGFDSLWGVADKGTAEQRMAIVDRRLGAFKDLLTARGHTLPGRFYWYCTRGSHIEAKELTTQAVKAAFGQHAVVDFFDLEWAVSKVLAHEGKTEELFADLGYASRPLPMLDAAGGIPTVLTAGEQKRRNRDSRRERLALLAVGERYRGQVTGHGNGFTSLRLEPSGAPARVLDSELPVQSWYEVAVTSIVGGSVPYAMCDMIGPVEGTDA